MPRNPNNPRRKLTANEKLEKKLKNLSETGATQSNILLVEKFVKSQIRDGKSRVSSLTYVTSLRYVLKNTRFELSEATRDDIEEFLDVLETWECEQGRNKGQPLSPFTKNTIKMQFKTFLQFIGKGDEAEIIHCRNLKGSKLPEDILSKDEILEIVDHAGSLRDKAMFGLLYESGCRVGELLSMKVKNVEFIDSGGAAITFPQGKTGPRRVLVFNFASYLRQWISAHPKRENPDAPLWPTDDYRQSPLSDIGLRYLLRETVKRTNIKKRVWIHGFRHSRATHLSEHLSDQQMKGYLGWTPGSDLPAVYCHLSGKDVDKSIKAMYGIEEAVNPIDTMKPGKCPRCGELNVSNALYCFKCGMHLKQEVSTLESNAENTALTLLQSESVLMTEFIKNLREGNPELIKALQQSLK
ncbi:site-specific integrase [Methanosarcina barkeri]|uniref:Phage integrase family protein n=1 Tax=Methanosarcina barkeri CM1 TaxID=796385 RepID=A0A0G3CCM8_METBA|nr:site-specific integrase [Methanosarcina barkeri]AKJ39764.1 phage integrase family protein [Methanosarcina barkeri CM1]